MPCVVTDIVFAKSPSSTEFTETQSNGIWKIIRFRSTGKSGKTTTLYAFVMLLGYSRAMYVEFVERCTLETFLDCHIHAFHFLQGVPAEVLYDNMKNVVLGRENGKTVFNLEFLHFAHHYGFQPKTCPPYSPWVKGKVERPMDYIRERFWRGYSFHSLPQANGDMVAWLDEKANQRIHGTHRQLIALRWAEEIPRLGKLPPGAYDTSVKVSRKVYKENVIFLGPPGVGKTHLAIALAIKVCCHGFKVYFTTMNTLISKLQETQSKGKAYLNCSLVIVGEVGYLPVNSQEAYLFFQFISYRYEKSSTIITSNKSFIDWQELFGDSVITSAILDRLLHQCKVINIKGHSYRLKEHAFHQHPFPKQGGDPMAPPPS